MRQLIQQRLAKLRRISGGRKNSSMTRHPTHPPRRRIMHRPAQQTIEVWIYGSVEFVIMGCGRYFGNPSVH